MPPLSLSLPLAINTSSLSLSLPFSRNRSPFVSLRKPTSSSLVMASNLAPFRPHGRWPQASTRATGTTGSSRPPSSRLTASSLPAPPRVLHPGILRTSPASRGRPNLAPGARLCSGHPRIHPPLSPNQDKRATCMGFSHAATWRTWVFQVRLSLATPDLFVLALLPATTSPSSSKPSLAPAFVPISSATSLPAPLFWLPASSPYNTTLAASGLARPWRP